MTQSHNKNTIETTSYKMSLKKSSTSNDTTTSSDSDDASDCSSNSSSSSSSEASIEQKSSSVTKFSIQKNDTGSGLRMKLTAIPKSPFRENKNAVTNANVNQKPLNKERKESQTASNQRNNNNEKMLSKKQRQDSSSNSSCCSACTESDDDSDSSSLCSKNKRTTKPIKHYSNNKTDKNRRAVTTSRTVVVRKKVSTESSDTNSDSSDDSSDDESIEKHSPMPKSQRNFKNDLLKNATGVASNQNLADNASSSDMELPALVRAAIQRVESCSDGENSKVEQNNSTQYTSSLLRDFVAKTQMLGSNLTNANNILTSKTENDGKTVNAAAKKAKCDENDDKESFTTKTKKKRGGRPRKQLSLSVDVTKTNDNNASGSPDSGIISTPQSPVPSSNQSSKSNKNGTMTIAKKLDISTLEKSMYATERVLYPPRRKKQQSNIQLTAANITKSLEQNGRQCEKVDPVWRKIDINKKFRRPSECGYRSDTNTICSKLLAKQSGYTSDYGNVNRRILSGYKSDCSVKAKSCGYRSDCSTKHRRKIRRKRRTKTMSTKPLINDQDLLMLAGLSLGHSDESSLDSTDKTQFLSRTSQNTSSKMISSNKGKTSTLNKSLSTSIQKLNGKDLLNSSSDRTTTKRANCNSSFDTTMPSFNNSLPLITSSIYKDGDSNSLKLDRMKPGLIRRRRSSAVSHCSSHCSTNSRHPFRRRRRRRLRSTCDPISEPNLAKLNMQIDLLSNSFTSLCTIFVEKPSREKEKNSQTTKSTGSKRAGKKRKTNQENGDTTSSNTTASTTTTKRRNKKTVQTKSPDDHKLPLKKRHYLMSTSGEKSENVQSANKKANDDDRNSEQGSPDNEIDVLDNNKAITPKKRHLLQTPVDLNDVVDSTDATSSSTCKDLQEIQASVSISITGSSAVNKSSTQSKKTEIARKKSRLEGLVSKISPTQSNGSDSNVKSSSKDTTKSATSHKNLITKEKTAKISTTPKSSSQKQSNLLTTKSSQILSLNPFSAAAIDQKVNSSRSSLNSRSHKSNPIPPGVFEPSIDLELQIPFTEIPIPVMNHKSIDTVVETARGDAIKAKKSDTKNEKVVEKLFHRTGAAQAIVKKKRKKPNRTGFPTLKKKKKPIAKPQTETSPTADMENIIPSTPPIDDTATSNENNKLEEKTKTKMSSSKAKQCDRVPSEGETAGTFIERNSKPRLAIVSIERLQEKTKENSRNDEKSPSRKRNKIEKTQKNSKDIDNDMKIDSSTEKMEKSKANIKTDIKRNDTNNSPSRKSKTQEIESMLTTRRSRSVNSSLQPEINKKTNAAIDSVKISNSKSLSKVKHIEKESVAVTSVGKTVDRSAKKKMHANHMDVASKKEKKLFSSNEIKKSAINHDKLEKGSKRTVNGRIISGKNEKVSQSVEKSETTHNSRSNKKFRHDNDSENKSKTNKRSSSSAHNSDKNVEIKRMRIDLVRETSKSPTKKNSKIENHVNEETITDINDIVSVDEWIENEHQEPLPLEENVNNIESELNLVQTNDGKKNNSKLKKKYLIAGLFSNYYKEQLHSPTERPTKSSIDKKAANLNGEEHPTESLLPMPFYSKQILETQMDFCLPYDLWYANENDKLTGRNIVHSWNFKKIRTNIYSDSVKPIQTSELPQCSCKPEYLCGDNCLNRLVYTECNTATCPSGNKCQNTNIQRHIVAPVERFMTANKGWGVRTNQSIKKGTYILEYVGEVVTEREFKERMATLYTSDIHHYCLHLDGGLVIDGHRMGSDCRFVNHSCEPNCEMQKWSVSGLSRMALFAMRTIQPGEELTYDYNFSLFNPADGQVCKCGSKQCRGVIGGKSQRVRVIENKSDEQTLDPKKGRSDRSKQPKRGGGSKSKGFMHSKDHSRRSNIPLPSAKEQILVADGHCFLLRNLRKMRASSTKVASVPQTNASSVQISLTAKISALRVPRNIRTRGVTIAEHDPVVEKTIRIAVILREVCEELNSFKDASGQYAISKLNLPSKKKCPQYYEKIKNPIDLPTIEANVEKGVYEKPTLFDADVNRLFANALDYYGNDSAEAIITMQLQSIYSRKKTDLYEKLEAICGSSTELSTLLEAQSEPFLSQVEDPNEDHIRCICGLYRDEGVMIQCSDCKIWQHTECTGADIEAEQYICEKCKPRNVEYEIPLKEKTEEGYTYYLSLMRGKDLQIRQSDTVYVLRDIPIENDQQNNGDKTKIKKHTYETIGEIDYNECDIFRVERMWKDDDGKRFVFGHHYLRPHETYHEPTRKFYQNEVVRVPLYEVVPIELIMGRCWVMDLNTFCKGRPVDSIESHVYICELRVDKAARLFSKISKNPYPVCTKSYAFKKFRQRLKISRSYLPHDVDSSANKQTSKKRRAAEEISTQLAKKASTPIVQLMPPPQKTMNEKRTRLEKYLSILMLKQQSLNEEVQPLDLSYLLTGRGARRRNNITHVPHKN